MIVQNITDDGKFASLTFTVSKDDQLKAVKELKNQRLSLKKFTQIAQFVKFQL